ANVFPRQPPNSSIRLSMSLAGFISWLVLSPSDLNRPAILSSTDTLGRRRLARTTFLGMLTHLPSALLFSSFGAIWGRDYVHAICLRPSMSPARYLTTPATKHE